MQNVASFPKAYKMAETMLELYKTIRGNAESFEPVKNGIHNLHVNSWTDTFSKKGAPMLVIEWQDIKTGRTLTTYTMHSRKEYHTMKNVRAGDLYRAQVTGSGGFPSVTIFGEHTIDDFDTSILEKPTRLSKGCKKATFFIYDIEVFKHDILIVARDYFTKEWFVFHNDLEGFRQFYLDYRDSMFIGFNNSGYDNHVVRGYLQGKNPYTLSHVIIDGERSEVYKLYDTKKTTVLSMDLYQDNKGFSLKEHCGFLGLNIMETHVNFDLDRPLTKEESILNELYCKNDVLGTELRFEQNISMLMAKMVLVATYGLDKTWLGQTNANLTAKILGAVKTPDRGDERDYYELPDGFIIKNKEVLENMTGELAEKINFMVEQRDLELVLGEGGSHSAQKKYINVVDTMYHNDATSLHPSSMRLFDLESRNIPEEKQGTYQDIINRRIEAKHNKNLMITVNGVEIQGWVLDLGYKLPLNGTYGAMGAEFNKLYDPRQRLLVCLVGQLAFYDLFEKVEPLATIVQSNTDAIDWIPYDEVASQELETIMRDWEQRTGYELDSEAYVEMWQRDVNNYVQRMEDDKVNIKGGIGLTRGLRINKAIVSNAFVNYLLNGIDPREFIDQCNELRQYQIISKTGHTFNMTVGITPDETLTELQKVNRSFAVKPEYGAQATKIRKVKFLEAGVDFEIEEDEEITFEATSITVDNEKFTADKIQFVTGIANEPEYGIIDNEEVGKGAVSIDMIDKQYYIDLTYRELKKWFGADWRERCEQAHEQRKEKREPLPIKNYMNGD